MHSVHISHELLLKLFKILFIKELLCASHCITRSYNLLGNMMRYVIILIIRNNNIVTLGDIGKPILGKYPDLTRHP